MRKFLFTTAIVGLCSLCACTDDDVLKTSDVNAITTTSNPIIEAAQKAYSECYPSSSRNGSVNFYEHNILPITTLKSRVSSPDTVLYIVNEAEGNGFVALTGGNYPEVLAVSDNGTITDINNIDNPGLQMFFDAATEYASTSGISGPIIIKPIDPVPAFKEVLITEADNVCEPRCTVQWGQSYPAGKYCPNSIAGCVPLAGAQALSYFESPDTLNLTYANADKAQITLSWMGIKKYVKSMSWSDYNNYNNGRTPFQLTCEDNLGRLCRELGERVQAVYSPNVTSAYTYDMAILLSQINPSLNVRTYWGTPIARNELGNGIIMMRGERYTNEADSVTETHKKCSGHSWIVDGYRHKIIHHEIYLLDSDGNYTYSPSASFTERLDVQHINWGWNGTCNGYFNLDVFNPSASTIYDTNDTYSPYNYTHEFYYCIITKK